MKYILIVDAEASEIIPEYIEDFPNIPVSQRYHPDFVNKLLPVEDDVTVEIGWVYDDITKTFHVKEDKEEV